MCISMWLDLPYSLYVVLALIMLCLCVLGNHIYKKYIM